MVMGVSRVPITVNTDFRTNIEVIVPVDNKYNNNNTTTSNITSCDCTQVVRAVSRHLQGAHWQEASRVLKVLVARWQESVSMGYGRSAVLLG